MKKSYIIIFIIVFILLIISILFNILLIANENLFGKSYLEGKYEGGRTYYNYNDDTEYVITKDLSDLIYMKTNNTLVFYKDGTMAYNNLRGTYTNSPKMKTVTFSFIRNNYEETYTFEVSNDLKILKTSNKGKDTGKTNGQANPYYIEKYVLK